MSQLHAERTHAPEHTGQARQRTGRTAVWSLVLAITALGGAGSLLGTVLGARTRVRTRETGERGATLGLTAIVLGAVALVVAVGYWIAYGRHTGGGGGGGGGGGNPGGGGGY